MFGFPGDSIVKGSIHSGVFTQLQELLQSCRAQELDIAPRIVGKKKAMSSRRIKLRRNLAGNAVFAMGWLCA